MMMTIEEAKSKLQGILSPKRFGHSVNVMHTAIELAERYGADRDKAAMAGLLHDCAREIRGPEVFSYCERFNIKIDPITRIQPELLHGPLGSKLAVTDYGVEDEAILSAIYCHTTGRENMSMLDKLIFIADYIEPNRSFPGVNEVRSTAFSNIDTALVIALDRTIKHVMSKGTLIHPDTIGARNSIILPGLKPRLR